VVLPAKNLLIRAVRKLLGATAASLAAFAVLGSALEHGAFASPSSTSTAEGYDLGNVESPRALAMGGGLAATGASTVGLYQNPANMELSRVYHFEADGAFSPEARRYDFGGAIVDSGERPLRWRARRELRPARPGRHPSELDRLSSRAVVSARRPPRVRACRALSRRRSRHERRPVRRQLDLERHADEALGQYLTFDAGMTVTLMEGLHIGIVGTTSRTRSLARADDARRRRRLRLACVRHRGRRARRLHDVDEGPGPRERGR